MNSKRRSRTGLIALRVAGGVLLVLASTLLFSSLIHVNAFTVGFAYLITVLLLAASLGLAEAVAALITATIEHKTDRATIAFEYQLSSERVASSGTPRAQWMSGQLPIHWNVHGPWSVTVRPEVAWDRDGRWTLARQTVKAVTNTLEYRLSYKQANTILASSTVGTTHEDRTAVFQ